jgi:hypothetical protein
MYHVQAVLYLPPLEGSFADCALFVFQRKLEWKNDIDDDPVEIGSVEEEVGKGNDEVMVDNEDDNGDSRDRRREELD